MLKVGIDIGGTKIHIGIFDEKTKALLADQKSYVADVTDLSAHIKETLAQLCQAKEIGTDMITSCGIGIPGTVSADGRKIIKAPNIRILSDSMVEDLEKELGVPVQVVQDSRAAAWGEYISTGASTIVCVTLGTGIGTGIVIDGKLYAGGLGCAGELGHLPVVENGRPCGCGKSGCLEKYCAGGGLDITARQLLGEGKTAADLFKEAKNGNTAVQKVIHDAVVTLGRAMVAIVNLLSPDCLLFSGGLCLQEELFLSPIIDYVKTHCYSTGPLPIIKRATLGELSPLYGAAFLPQD